MSPSKLAKIENNKTLVPQGAGTITLTATADKNKKKASVKLKLVDPTLPTGIKLSYAAGIQLPMGQKLPLEYTLLPEGTAVSEVNWKVSPGKLATIDADGCLVPLGTGKVTLTATTRNNKKATATIQIVDGAPIVALRVDVGGITSIVNGDEANAQAIATFEYNGTRTEDAVSPAWSSSNKSVLTVDANGVVRAVGEGQADVIATVTRNGQTHKAACTLTVTHRVVPITSVQVTLDGQAVGSEALTVFSTSHTLRWTIDGDADLCTLNLYDDGGSLVKTATCDPADGTLTLGDDMANGVPYTFRFGVRPWGQPDTATLWTEFVAERRDTGDFTVAILSDGTLAITGYTGTASAVEIPSTLINRTVTHIGDEAFMNMTGITQVILPATLEVIGQRAFMGCTGLTAIQLPGGLRQIQAGAFKQCSNLASVSPAA